MVGVRVCGRWLALAATVVGGGVLGRGARAQAPVARADDGPGCDPVGPCGGELLGSWRLVRTCADLAPPSALCRAAPVDESQLGFDGSLGLDEHGGFAISVTPRGTWTAAVPDHCLVGLSCADFGDAVAASGQSAPLERVRCEDSADACRCSFRLRRQTQSARGSFTTAGGILTLDRGGGPDAAVDYCV